MFTTTDVDLESLPNAELSTLALGLGATTAAAGRDRQTAQVKAVLRTPFNLELRTMDFLRDKWKESGLNYRFSRTPRKMDFIAGLENLSIDKKRELFSVPLNFNFNQTQEMGSSSASDQDSSIESIITSPQTSRQRIPVERLEVTTPITPTHGDHGKTNFGHHGRQTNPQEAIEVHRNHRTEYRKPSDARQEENLIDSKQQIRANEDAGIQQTLKNTQNQRLTAYFKPITQVNGEKLTRVRTKAQEIAKPQEVPADRAVTDETTRVSAAYGAASDQEQLSSILSRVLINNTSRNNNATQKNEKEHMEQKKTLRGKEQNNVATDVAAGHELGHVSNKESSDVKQSPFCIHNKSALYNPDIPVVFAESSTSQHKAKTTRVRRNSYQEYRVARLENLVSQICDRLRDMQLGIDQIGFQLSTICEDSDAYEEDA